MIHGASSSTIHLVYGSANVTAGTFSSTSADCVVTESNGTFSMSGGNLSSSSKCAYWCKGGVGTISGTSVLNGKSDGVAVDGTCYIKGGTIVGKGCGVINPGGNVTVSGGNITGQTWDGLNQNSSNTGTKMTVTGGTVKGVNWAVYIASGTYSKSGSPNLIRGTAGTVYYYKGGTY